METKTLYLRPLGFNGAKHLRDMLDDFVVKHFELLFEGAARMGIDDYNIEGEPYGMRIENTVINRSHGLYYAGGHKKGSWRCPTKKELEDTVRDIQRLIDEASKEIPAPFELEIKKLR